MPTDTANVRQLIIDRLEGQLAVVEVDGSHFLPIPRWLLPAAAVEDDVLSLTSRTDEAGNLIHEIRLDPAATARARAEAEALVGRLRKKNPGGDLVL